MEHEWSHRAVQTYVRTHIRTYMHRLIQIVRKSKKSWFCTTALTQNSHGMNEQKCYTSRTECEENDEASRICVNPEFHFPCVLRCEKISLFQNRTSGDPYRSKSIYFLNDEWLLFTPLSKYRYFSRANANPEQPSRRLCMSMSKTPRKVEVCTSACATLTQLLDADVQKRLVKLYITWILLGYYLDIIWILCGYYLDLIDRN